MSDLERLLELQLADSALDQMAYRRAHLEERLAFNAARERVQAERRALGANVARRGELEQQYASLEASGTEIDVKVRRLDGQMRNVVVTREAEAIQREIATLRARRDAGDEQGLLLLGESEGLSADAARLEDAISVAETAEAAAASLLAVADALLDAETSMVTSRRSELTASLPEALAGLYAARRPTFKGVAVAKLQGTRCTGCHLDLSRLEIEALRAVPQDELPECPQCARILVLPDPRAPGHP